MSSPLRRLDSILRTLSATPSSSATLNFGGLTYDVPDSLTPTRLPHSTTLLDPHDPVNSANLYFLFQKFLLGQDVFLVSQPGPYARRLALTFCSLINAEYEHVSLHRDVGETELKQGREIRAGGALAYVDSAAVRAVKAGRILIIEGIEKAERGIMPVLNNLLENREMNLDDGTHIVHPRRHALIHEKTGTAAAATTTATIPAHPSFRVIALGVPVPPYKGFPLDPPFRSRFQARFIDALGSLRALAGRTPSQEDDDDGGGGAPSSLLATFRDIIFSVQYSSELADPLENISRSTLPPFPQNSLQKLAQLVQHFPPPPEKVMPPEQLARLVLALHPVLAHSPLQSWALLSRRFEEAGLGPLGSPSSAGHADGSGFLGYRAVAIERVASHSARVAFERAGGGAAVQLDVPAGPLALAPFPPPAGGTASLLASNRFLGLLACFLQAHALGWDVSYVPPVLPSTASCSTSLLVHTFAGALGYDVETIHLYKELGGREILMRRRIEEGGATTWEPSPLIKGVWDGRLVHLSGLDVLGSTAGSIGRLLQDREIELWEGKRIVASASAEELAGTELSVAHPSFRVVATASKSAPLRDWLTEEHATMFCAVPAQPMDESEERAVLLRTGAPAQHVRTLLGFAEKYRQTMTSDAAVQKNRKLGTRSLVRVARRLAAFPWDDDLHAILSRSILADFLPAPERISLDTLFAECGVTKRTALYNPAPSSDAEGLLFFPESSDPLNRTKSVLVPRFDPAQDPEGVASHVPHMEHFYDNSIQTGLMRDVAVDLEILKEHLVLLGNQGVGKNKVVDRICQLLGRPREYVQLHRDTTVNQLMFTTHLEDGMIRYIDSPLLRAITYGRVIIIDEADKAPEHVVAVVRSLAGQGELTLADGRRVRRTRERADDVVVHPNFRMILLANRPGYPFLGNHFLQVLGDNFSCHAVSNPDTLSERRLLAQLAPEMDGHLIRRLVAAFQDLRRGYEQGTLSYPYSLRELINLVRHMRTYDDSLETSLRNVFDFDVYKPETMEALADILAHHGLEVKRVGFDAVREEAGGVKDIKYEPKGSTALDAPKYGKEDPNNDEHHGGNTWAGGTGGRDTAGLGGRGGYMRLFSGNEIKQVSDKLKAEVPDHIREQARKMAREELARRLEELNMSSPQATGYSRLLAGVESHVARLLEVLENLSAKEEERVWVKRQTDGELDDTRLADGLTGEATVYKRRGMAKPELGRPQIKPKRIRFLFDVSGSMYRFQADGRLQRSLETAVMLMETFARLSQKEKYVWDIYGHSGDSPTIPLLEAGSNPNILERWKVTEKMNMITQYAYAGDYTVEAIQNSVAEVSKFDADDWFVIAISDANFGRYEITAEDLKRSMDYNPKVHTALICIGEGAEATWIPKNFPRRAFRVTNTPDIPNVLRSILGEMVS